MLKSKVSGAISHKVSRDASLKDISPSRATKAVSIKFPEAADQPMLGGTQRLQPGMSNAVAAVNEDLCEADRQVKDMEKKRIAQMRELESYDCADMLKTAGVKIKVMN